MGNGSTLQDTMHAFYKVRNASDVDGIFGYLDPTCSFRIAGTDKLGTFTQRFDEPVGLRAAVTALVGDWDLSGLSTVSSHADGDTVFVHRKGDVRFIPTGAVIDTEVLDKVRFDSGKIVEYVQFIDTYLVAQTAGLI